MEGDAACLATWDGVGAVTPVAGLDMLVCLSVGECRVELPVHATHAIQLSIQLSIQPDRDSAEVTLSAWRRDPAHPDGDARMQHIDADLLLTATHVAGHQYSCDGLIAILPGMTHPHLYVALHVRSPKAVTTTLPITVHADGAVTAHLTAQQRTAIPLEF